MKQKLGAAFKLDDGTADILVAAPSALTVPQNLVAGSYALVIGKLVGAGPASKQPHVKAQKVGGGVGERMRWAPPHLDVFAATLHAVLAGVLVTRVLYAQLCHLGALGGHAHAHPRLALLHALRWSTCRQTQRRQASA